MANALQRIIYYVANAVPLLLMTALAWGIQYKTWLVSCILIAFSAFITMLFAVCFTYGKTHCSTKTINVTAISSKDAWLFAYVVAYLFPFAYKVMPDFHIVSLIVVILMVILVFISSIMALPNILLFIIGYHFYKIGTESTGISDYLLISKRKHIRNKTDIKNVMRIFEKLLIDTKEE
ncbi:hypothetical protein [Clostridium luticellarii]|uniref:Uncharacterized protein n=1 Tax=Clostridium luticellarii TaxID=1691940 RepID=A0A2T0B7Y8_9CLOT|nr:hypothetical protein [Clostridium luticellarii]PRR79965.1 hypothetical protein CLLU_34050 [Clostridium luticellarii]